MIPIGKERAKLTERGLTLRIIKALRARGYLVTKTHGSALVRGGVGDLIVCYQGRYIELEVKMPGGKVRPLQTQRGVEVHRAGGLWGIVTSVEEALSSLTAPAQSVTVLKDLGELAGGWPDDESVEEFLDDLRGRQVQ